MMQIFHRWPCWVDMMLKSSLLHDAICVTLLTLLPVVKWILSKSVSVFLYISIYMWVWLQSRVSCWAKLSHTLLQGGVQERLRTDQEQIHTSSRLSWNAKTPPEQKEPGRATCAAAKQKKPGLGSWPSFPCVTHLALFGHLPRCLFTGMGKRSRGSANSKHPFMPAFLRPLPCLVMS